MRVARRLHLPELWRADFVLRLVHHTRIPATEFLENAVMRDGLADERVGAWHVEHILG